MASAHQRYRRRAGSAESVRFVNDADLPRSDAPAEKWEQFHQKHSHRGTFDPCSILRDE
jgi:hypothetical protein